jgi:arylsulfatase
MLFGGFELEVEVAHRTGDGVLVALGDRHGGFALFLADGHLTFCFAGPEVTTEVRSPAPVPTGASLLGVAYTPEDGGRFGLSINGEIVATAAHHGQIPVAFQHGGCHLRLGFDVEQTVSAAYDAPGHLDGDIVRATISTTPDAVASAAAIIRTALRGD